MQKFKFNKNNLPISIRSRLTPIDMQQLPDFIELEGELLEGSTEERKGCWGCVICYKSDCTPGICGCHNKKEEGYKWLDIKIEAKGKDFNRETPKECPSDHVIKDGKCAVTDGFIKCVCKCSFCPVGEEVKLPEMLVVKPGPITVERAKINEILDYLASKENK